MKSFHRFLGWDGLRMEVVTDASVSEKVMSTKKFDILGRF